MAGCLIRFLAKHKPLFTEFKTHPVNAIKKLEKEVGMQFGQVNLEDIEIVMGLSEDELELLGSIAERTGGKTSLLRGGDCQGRP